ncbi:MAG: VCBS repeat-containing protein, partial [Bacteroidota bacterium]
DLPVEDKIYFFNVLSARDIWFNVNQATITCLLYHYHDGITEIIQPPLANSITSMYFISENKALFSGFADIAIFENGSFRTLPPSPARSSIIRIFSKDLTDFYVLSGSGELFLYEQGCYKKILSDCAVTDFCFTGMHDGWILSGEQLFRANTSGVRPIYKNKDLLRVNKMKLMRDGSLLMVGNKGLIMRYADGRLLFHDAQCAENLTDLIVTGTDEIWICGDNGRLLYSGNKKFPEYNEGNQGFAPYKLIYYGINTDDEYGVAMADFNNDDKLDIYAVRIYEQNRLYINNLSSLKRLNSIDGFFEEAVKRNATGVINPENGAVQNELKLGISAADIDNDNDQDIYLCYLNSNNKLLLNDGHGYFRNVSMQKNRACENMKRSNAAAFSDVDNDGDLDLFVTSEEGSNRLFENDGTGHFTDITISSGLGTTGGGMCASFADVNNDGYPDLCVTFWYPSNKLYINESVKGKIHFRDVTHLTDLAKAAPSKSNGVVFADVNNDGFIDLFIANRNNGNKLYLNDGHGKFTDKTRDYFSPEKNMSNGAVFADFDLDGYQDLYVTNVGENVFYKNMNGKYFKDVTASFGAELSGYCTGCATGDVDNDGDPDLYVANYINGNSNLFLNITEKKSFVKLKLHGVRSNKDAIGTKVWLFQVSGEKLPRTLAGYRELNGGSGYGSVSAKEMIFGVAPGCEYYALVKFPSSPDTIRMDHIKAGKILEVNELKGFLAFYTESRNRMVRFFTDQENQPEIIKYVIVLLLLFSYNLKLRKSIRNFAILRWLTTGFIFILFVFINQVFLFQWFRQCLPVSWY